MKEISVTQSLRSLSKYMYTFAVGERPSAQESVEPALLRCKYIDKGSGPGYTLKITNVKQLLRFMNEKMKGNKVKAEENILKWMIDKGKSIKNRRPYTIQTKNGIHFF